MTTTGRYEVAEPTSPFHVHDYAPVYEVDERGVTSGRCACGKVERNNPVRALAAAKGVDLQMAETIARHQTTCAICGYGMIVKPWGVVVAEKDQVVVDAQTGTTTGVSARVTFHAGCLVANAGSAATRIAEALALVEPEI